LRRHSEVSIDVSKMMEQKAKSVTGLTQGIEGLFKKNKAGGVLENKHLTDAEMTNRIHRSV
jgi:pyruvate/2-oxoglutarate dehydrogenase complex dihydrolipoamide dehydrogenase (E3) component